MKQHCIIALKCKWQQRPRTGLQPYSKIMVRNHDVIDLVLCQECGFQSHQTTWSIPREKHLYCSSDFCIIQSDLCLKRETTVCYKWLPRKWPKLVPCFIKSHSIQTQRVNTLWRLSLPKVIDIVPCLLKLKCNGGLFFEKQFQLCAKTNNKIINDWRKAKYKRGKSWPIVESASSYKRTAPASERCEHFLADEHCHHPGQLPRHPTRRHTDKHHIHRHRNTCLHCRHQ